MILKKGYIHYEGDKRVNDLGSYSTIFMYNYHL